MPARTNLHTPLTLDCARRERDKECYYHRPDPRLASCWHTRIQNGPSICFRWPLSLVAPLGCLSVSRSRSLSRWLADHSGHFCCVLLLLLLLLSAGRFACPLETVAATLLALRPSPNSLKASNSSNCNVRRGVVFGAGEIIRRSASEPVCGAASSGRSSRRIRARVNHVCATERSAAAAAAAGHLRSCIILIVAGWPLIEVSLCIEVAAASGEEPSGAPASKPWLARRAATRNKTIFIEQQFGQLTDRKRSTLSAECAIIWLWPAPTAANTRVAPLVEKLARPPADRFLLVPFSLGAPSWPAASTPSGGPSKVGPRRSKCQSAFERRAKQHCNAPPTTTRVRPTLGSPTIITIALSRPTRELMSP